MTSPTPLAGQSAFFHLVCRSSNRAHVLRRPRDYRAFIDTLATAGAMPNRPLAFVTYAILSNEWHLLVGPTDPPAAARLYARVAATHDPRWRTPTFGHTPAVRRVASLDLIETARAIERAPLRAGLVRRAQDWPWAALAERLRPGTCLPLADAPFLSSASWIAFVNEPWLSSRHDVAEYPRLFARGREFAENGINLFGRAHQDETDTHVERPEHLSLVHAASLLEPREKRRNGPTAAIE